MLQKSYFDYRKPLTLDDMLVSQAIVFSIKVLIEVFMDQKVIRTVGLLIGRHRSHKNEENGDVVDGVVDESDPVDIEQEQE